MTAPRPDGLYRGGVPFDPAVDAEVREGFAAVRTVTADWTGTDWSRPACGIWTGTQLAGHLVTVVGWYHDWLDRARAGDAEPAFPAAALDAMTAAALATLPAGDGPSRVARFAAEAERYADRVAQEWDTPFGYPRGRVTAGAHAALSGWEWHVHAWDLARSAGADHRPADSLTLYRRGTECFVAATGARAPDPDPADPWAELLRRTGRSP